MRAYELMVIVDADVDDAGVKAVNSRIGELIAADGGEVVKTDAWGRRRYAYPIKHKLEGIYTVFDIATPASNLDELDRFLRLADDVVRHKIIRLPDSEAERSGQLATIEGTIPMANGNNVELTGNATRDPELRFTPSGQPVATFGLAVNRRWQNRQTQQWEEAVSYFDIVCWGQLAENVAESITKGTRLMVTGRLDQRTWETQEGDKRSKVEIVATRSVRACAGQRQA